MHASKWLKYTAAVFSILFLTSIAVIGYIDYNQKKILNELVSVLSKNVRGELSIEKVSLTIFSEFPNLSVTLHNGVIKDSIYHKEVFRAGKLYCRINPFKLLFKHIDVRSVIIQDGNVFLQQDSTGLNANLFKVSTDTGKGPLNISFNLKELKINNLQISFNDEVRNKHISLKANNLKGNVSQQDSSFMVNLHGFIHTDSMMFKADKGSFVFNRDAQVDVHLNYNKILRKLTINPSPVMIDSQKYSIEGYFSVAQKPAFLKLLITSPAANFDKARMVLSDKIRMRMKDISVTDPVEVSVLIQGPIMPDLPPEVDANFILKNAHIQYYAAQLSEVDMKGLFMNHVAPGVKNDDKNSELVFDFTRAKINGIPATARVSVVDLKALHAELTAAINTPLTNLNQTFGADSVNYRFNSGTAAVNINYKGTIYYYLDSIKHNFDDTLTGTVKLTNGTFIYANRGLRLSNMQTDITFTQNQIDIKNISCAINGNAINLSGTVNSLRRMVSGEVDKMEGHLVVESPKFDLNKVLVMKKENKPAPVAMSAAQGSKITALIDTITNMLSLGISVKCDELIFRKLNAYHVKGNLSVSSATGLDLKDLSLSACKGEILLNGNFRTIHQQDVVSARMDIKNIDVKQFLTDLQNFDQSTITDSNIVGKLNAQVNFSTPLKPDYAILMDSMTGQIHFSLLNGSLNNFQPLASVGEKIFKKRNFNHVAFAEIKDTVNLHNNTFYFHKMEIASSVMRLFIQGRFSFKGLVDLAIQVPLNNLKKQDIDYQPENIGLDAKAGPSIFLHALSDKNNKVKISLDPTARQRMKKGVSDKPIL